MEGKSAFWREWTVATDATKFASTSFTEAAVAKELSRASELEVLVTNLYNEITDLQDHQQVMKRRRTAE